MQNIWYEMKKMAIFADEDKGQRTLPDKSPTSRTDMPESQTDVAARRNS